MSTGKYYRGTQWRAIGPCVYDGNGKLVVNVQGKVDDPQSALEACETARQIALFPTAMEFIYTSVFPVPTNPLVNDTQIHNFLSVLHGVSSLQPSLELHAALELNRKRANA